MGKKVCEDWKMPVKNCLGKSESPRKVMAGLFHPKRKSKLRILNGNTHLIFYQCFSSHFHSLFLLLISSFLYSLKDLFLINCACLSIWSYAQLSAGTLSGQKRVSDPLEQWFSIHSIQFLMGGDPHHKVIFVTIS